MPGGHLSSRASVAPVGRLVFERVILKKNRLSDKVIGIIQASRRPSTTWIYEATWRAFRVWYAEYHVDPTSAVIQDILDYLQAGFEKGLATTTLRRQTSALSTVISCPPYQSLSHHPWVRGFLHRATNLRPPTVNRYPSWDLPLVLQTLTAPPFEPLGSILLKFLSFKVAFLLVIISAWRISELAALSVRKDLCIFHANTVVLRLDPVFTPKVNSSFHRAQEIVLPDFCPSPRHHCEVRWHTLDVHRALRHYIRRTASFRRTEALLVSFHPASMGQKVSLSTVGRWIKACIASAYEQQAWPLPGRILPHSTRSAATSVAWATQASVVDICRAATWTSLSPFIRHYRFDTYASVEASFGWRILQSVLSDSASGGSQPPAPEV